MRFIQRLNLGILLRVTGIVILVLLVGFYVQFQARNLLAGPVITLSDSSPVQHEQVITIEGSAKNIVKLLLNGKEIHTDAAGAFAQTLVLPEGYTIIELQAQDRFGRSTSLTREYVYVPAAM